MYQRCNAIWPLAASFAASMQGSYTNTVTSVSNNIGFIHTTTLLDGSPETTKIRFSVDVPSSLFQAICPFKFLPVVQAPP